ncbi:hypothetical protein Tsubulata_014938 [Turnera subulata]|uniref:EF-hand domain-containing protein n=1 Tax=Turnera subulata TaxID=218843 RepID=A0A9Q0FQ32_9ROSI|nr:hypothetical protein Tsubulata_014938 [Turnera subulata]
MAQLGSLSAESLTQVVNLIEAFRDFDANGDGLITAAELGGILGSLGYRAREQDVRAMMKQGDTNKDGLLSVQEFLGMNTKGMDFSGLVNCLNTAFEALEVDDDDDIVTGEELHEAMENADIGLSLGDCQSIIAAMDGDGDGAVSFEDLKLIVNALI